MAAATMDLDNPHNTNPFDWAHDTYMALDEGSYLAPHDKWPVSPSQPTPNMAAPAFSFPPSLLHDATVERFGQITPPEDLSPADRCGPRRTSCHAHDSRASSLSADPLRRDASWPGPNSLQALVDYQPVQEQNGHMSVKDAAARPESQSQSDSLDQSPPLKRRRTSKQASANQPARTQATPASHSTPPTATATSATPSTSTSTSTLDDAGNPQPPKRKRGRPKSQPQMVDAFTADGYPIQVSSARQSHLEKNRVAAHKCRQRKKEYIGGLEARARDFSSKNKALKDNVAMLREEVLTLKNEVLRHAGCGFWAVDEYLARCAGDLLGMDRPKNAQSAATPHYASHMVSPTLSTMDPTIMDRASSAESLSTSRTPDDHGDDNDDDYGGLDLLQDMDDGDD